MAGQGLPVVVTLEMETFAIRTSIASKTRSRLEARGHRGNQGLHPAALFCVYKAWRPSQTRLLPSRETPGVSWGWGTCLWIS